MDPKCHCNSDSIAPLDGMRKVHRIPVLEDDSDASHGQDLLLWQLADSAFPAGGFAHSSGLEATWQHREIGTPAALAGFIEASLWQCGRASLPFASAVVAAPERWFELDELCEACTPNHVANRASRLQGAAMLATAGRVFSSQSHRLGRGQAPSFGHWAPAFGAVAEGLGLPQKVAARLFLFLHQRSLVSAAVRLGVVGPLQGQSIQHRLSSCLEAVLGECLELEPEAACQTAPLLDLWQGTQDRLYSRLFQS